jgi:hypothetical protein
MHFGLKRRVKGFPAPKTNLRPAVVFDALNLGVEAAAGARRRVAVLS